jgi:hypothetical protein
MLTPTSRILLFYPSPFPHANLLLLTFSWHRNIFEGRDISHMYMDAQLADGEIHGLKSYSIITFSTIYPEPLFI